MVRIHPGPLSRIKIMKIFAKIFLTLFLYILISYFVVGITTKPTEGDSLSYHIPIAKTILNGKFLHPSDALYYFPSASESILALFMLLNIPLNLFNVLGVALLFFATYSLGLLYGLKRNVAIICSVSICTLHLTIRWISTQKIDIWLAVFFVCSLILMQTPKKEVMYFFKLGVALGLLVGTKFTAPFFAFILLVFFYKNLLKYINWYRLFSFLVPFSVFGLFWYVRNFIVSGNPIYPQPLLFFTGSSHYWNIFKSSHVWEAIFYNPTQMINAFFGDYVIWSIFIVLIAAVFVMSHKNLKSKLFDNKLRVLMFIGLINTCFYFFLPASSVEYHMMVSSLRYSYPAFIPLILTVFVIAQKYKKEELISLLAFASIITLPSLSYHPKLLFLLLPLMFIFLIFDYKTFYKYIKRAKFFKM